MRESRIAPGQLDIPEGDHAQDSRQSTLHNWWLKRAKQIGSLRESVTEINTRLRRIENSLDSATNSSLDPLPISNRSAVVTSTSCLVSRVDIDLMCSHIDQLAFCRIDPPEILRLQADPSLARARQICSPPPETPGSARVRPSHPLFSGLQPYCGSFSGCEREKCLTSGPTFVTLRPLNAPFDSGPTPRRAKRDFLSVGGSYAKRHKRVSKAGRSP